MTLAELGSQLKEERIAQGLMVEDVAARLKVPSRILRAIEEGNLRDLPHTVYTRGFIKGYALILGYSSEKIGELTDSIDDFDDEYSPPKTLEARPLGEDPKKKRKGGLRLFFKLLALLIVLAIGYVYYIHTFKGGEGGVSLPGYSPSVSSSEQRAGRASPTAESVVVNQPASTASPVPDVAAESPSANVSAPDPSGASESSEEAGLAAEMASGESQPVDEPALQVAENTIPDQAVSLPDEPAPSAQTIPQSPIPEAQIPAAIPEATAPVENGEFSPAPDEEPAPEIPVSRPIGSSESASVFGTETLPSTLPGDVQQIVLTAIADCWVHANADNGSSTREFSMKSGETFAMPFKTSLVLKLGNAGGVRIKYNGRDLPPVGTSGQVKTVTFPLTD